MLRIDWVEKPGFSNMYNPDPWWTVTSEYGGFFKVYPFMMTMGMIIAILISAYQFWKRDLNVLHLALGAAIIIPFSLFGASVFGKLNANGPGENASGVGFWGLFAFWKAGMSIHGGVYVGLIVGIIIFGIISRKTKVSLWVYIDCIVPNILLAQAIGRWGNFFNHEVMGAPVADLGEIAARNGANPLKGWIPNWILVNTQLSYNGDPFTLSNGLQIVSGHVYQMSPIFFYEFIAFLVGWLLLIWLVPNFGKWVGPKPWKKYPKEYSFKVGQSIGVMFQPWKWKQPYSKKNQTWTGIWNSAYYYQKDSQAVKEFNLKINDVKKLDKSKTTKRYQAMKVLNQANNVDHYWITKCGAQGMGYFFIWNFVRFFLELQRPENHLFIMYQKDLSLGLIMTTAVIGIVLLVLTQTVIPMFLRQPGWVYEKPYFKAKQIKF